MKNPAVLLVSALVLAGCQTEISPRASGAVPFASFRATFDS